jgi:hypothetical protein
MISKQTIARLIKASVVDNRRVYVQERCTSAEYASAREALQELARNVADELKVEFEDDFETDCGFND